MEKQDFKEAEERLRRDYEREIEKLREELFEVKTKLRGLSQIQNSSDLLVRQILNDPEVLALLHRKLSLRNFHDDSYLG